MAGNESMGGESHKGSCQVSNATGAREQQKYVHYLTFGRSIIT
jgi:hypothetical protein